jgi:pimeloyl-ACP methyl ester carboxylesterase
MVRLRHPARLTARVPTVAFVATLALAILAPPGAAVEAPTRAVQALPAAEPAESSCAAEADPGWKLPVVLVHGFAGDRHVWDNGTLTTQLAKSTVYQPYVFDYAAANHQWVTDSRIGPSLALFLHCLARRSAAADGPGKVAVVAHSMGGLATEQAMGETVAGTQVSTDVAALVTLGTPWTGVAPINGAPGVPETERLLREALEAGCGATSRVPGLSAVCDLVVGQHAVGAVPALLAGSSELAQLRAARPLPAGLPVTAIAGRIRVATSLFGHQYQIASVGDLLVPVASATSPPGGQVTTRVVDCGTVDLSDLVTTIPSVSCRHDTEPRDAKFGAEVLAALNRVAFPAGGPPLVHSPVAARTLAWATSDGVYVSGDAGPARVATVPAGTQVHDLTFSADGSRLGWLEAGTGPGDTGDGQTLAFVDPARPGVVQRDTMAYYHIVGLASGFAVLPGNTATSLTVAGPGVTTSSVPLSGLPDGQPLHLLAATGGGLLVGTSVPQSYYLLDPATGAARRVGSRSDQLISVAGMPTPAGAVALLDATAAESCVLGVAVDLVTPDLHLVWSDGRLPAGQSAAVSIGVAGDTVYAALTPAAPEQCRSGPVPTRLFSRARDGGWVDTGATDVSRVAGLASGSLALLHSPATLAGYAPPPGKLVVRSPKGHETALADGVTQIAAVPAQPSGPVFVPASAQSAAAMWQLLGRAGLTPSNDGQTPAACLRFDVADADFSHGDADFFSRVLGSDVGRSCPGDPAVTYYSVRAGKVVATSSACLDCEGANASADWSAVQARFAGRPVAVFTVSPDWSGLVAQGQDTFQ